MTITLELTPGMEASLKEEAARQGLTPEGLSEQAVMETLIAGLKDRPVPQSLDEIKPRRLPSGDMAMQIVSIWSATGLIPSSRAKFTDLSCVEANIFAL